MLAWEEKKRRVRTATSPSDDENDFGFSHECSGPICNGKALGKCGSMIVSQRIGAGWLVLYILPTLPLSTLPAARAHGLARLSVMRCCIRPCVECFVRGPRPDIVSPVPAGPWDAAEIQSKHSISCDSSNRIRRECTEAR
jgi:hypothetical protein